MIIKRLVGAATLFALLSTVPTLALEGPPTGRLAEAIRIPTVSYDRRADIDLTAFQRFLAFLETSYPRVHDRLEIERIGQYSLLITWRGVDTTRMPILFEAHYDVAPVEPGTENDWTHPPFAGVIADGYLWGRGAVDDKLSVIALLDAIEGLLGEGYRPQRDLVIALGHDEEIGGDQGAAAIAATLAARGLRFEYMVGEGGLVIDGFPALPESSVALVALAQKSYMTIRLHAAGQGGHSSMPPDDNALARLSRAVARLHDNRFEPALSSPVSAMLRALGPHVGGLRGFLLQQQWLSGSILAWQMSLDEATRPMVTTTTAVTIMQAGVKDNVVPQQASATVNFRLLPGDTPEDVVARVADIVDDPGVRIEVVRADAAPVVANAAGAGFAAVREAINRVLPDAVVVPGLVVATTDTRHYQALVEDVYHFHPIRMPMADAPGIHGTDERVAVSAVDTAVAMYRELLSAAGAN